MTTSKTKGGRGRKRIQHDKGSRSALAYLPVEHDPKTQSLVLRLLCSFETGFVGCPRDVLWSVSEAGKESNEVEIHRR